MRWIFGVWGGNVPGTVWVSQVGACVRKKGREEGPDEAAVGARVGSWWQEASGGRSGRDGGGISPDRPAPPGAEWPGDAFDEAAT